MLVVKAANNLKHISLNPKTIWGRCVVGHDALACLINKRVILVVGS